MPEVLEESLLQLVLAFCLQNDLIDPSKACIYQLLVITLGNGVISLPVVMLFFWMCAIQQSIVLQRSKRRKTDRPGQYLVHFLNELLLEISFIALEETGESGW